MIVVGIVHVVNNTGSLKNTMRLAGKQTDRHGEMSRFLLLGNIRVYSLMVLCEIAQS